MLNLRILKRLSITINLYNQCFQNSRVNYAQYKLLYARISKKANCICYLSVFSYPMVEHKHCYRFRQTFTTRFLRNYVLFWFVTRHIALYVLPKWLVTLDVYCTLIHILGARPTTELSCHMVRVIALITYINVDTRFYIGLVT